MNQDRKMKHLKNDSQSPEHSLEKYLWKYIPLSSAIGLEVENASSEKIILSAPFSNNINHKMTVFGGSLHSVATLACWSLLHVNMDIILKDAVQIVISNSNIDYLAPVAADFKAECTLPDPIDWERFIKTLRRKNKARINLYAKIHQGTELCVDYKGTFVAIKTKK
jgi:thioesterase domain-containing protein